MIHRSIALAIEFFFQFFLVFRYRAVIEELADMILSADVKTIEAIQDRYIEQVNIISSKYPSFMIEFCRLPMSPLHYRWMLVWQSRKSFVRRSLLV